MEYECSCAYTLTMGDKDRLQTQHAWGICSTELALVQAIHTAALLLAEKEQHNFVVT